jgi:serine/threonine protein kinase
LISGLGYLHSLGVAHLDLKLDNLVLDSNFQLRVIDFEGSYILGDESLLSRGTPCYRAPELLNLSLHDPMKADIFSSAIILFIMLNGKNLPYSEGTLIEGTDLLELLMSSPREFWIFHEEKLDVKFASREFKDLFEGMTRNAENRWGLEEIEACEWFNGEIYSKSELREEMSEIFRTYN